MSPATERFGLAVAVLIGVVVRVFPVVVTGTVVGDGGFIHGLVEDLRSADSGWPSTASYNALDIPFVYPPAALLVASFVGGALDISTLELLRWLPLVISCLTLVAFAWLASRYLGGVAAVGATFAFALMPSAYGWLVAGGGLTRGFGFLFALLATAVVARRSSDRWPWWMAVVTGALLGLSALGHPQGAIFGAMACVILSIRPPWGPWLARLATAAVTALAVTLPWLAWVASTNGLGALLAAGERVEPAIGIIRMLNLEFSGAPFMDVVGALGFVGLIVTLARREWRVPLLLAATYLSGSGGGEFLSAAPWALLAGTGAAALLELAVGALASASHRTGRLVVTGIGALVLFLGLIGSVGSASDRSSKLHALGDDRIAAMAWMAANLPADARIIVPTDEVWGFDDVSEWLPAIARRQSIGTVQGSEWLGEDGFRRQLRTHAEILACAGGTATCYAQIDARAVLFVPKGQLNGIFSRDACCPALRTTLTDAGYEVVYDGPGATIGVPSSGE